MTATPNLLYTTLESPLGELLLVGDEGALHGLHMQDGANPASIAPGWMHAEAPFAAARRQLGEYFAAERTRFELALQTPGTRFQRSVWSELETIRYGHTASYGELARRVGKPKAVRAVGMANGANPISIVVPCHRVIGAGGALTGYAGGLERKRFLLELEQGRAS